jgi:hypothetical protein
MNRKTGGKAGLRRGGALAVAAAVAALATACGSAPSPAGPALGASVTLSQEVALAHCMRSHGAPDFPDPDASGGFNLSTTPNGPPGTVDINSTQIQAAYGACRHLLAGGGPSISQIDRRIQQQRQRALPMLLKFARCMRSHGEPGFPDPTADGLPATSLKDAGISPLSPQFQASAQACQHVLPAGMHVTVTRHVSGGLHSG